MKNFNNFKQWNEAKNVDIDKSKFINFISQRNNQDINDVKNKFNDVEFIKLYRSEGNIVDRDKLPLAVKDSSGTWFTPSYKEVLRYNNMNDNRKIYEIDIPLGFYNSLRSSFSSNIEISKGEVKLPIELSKMKTQI